MPYLPPASPPDSALPPLAQKAPRHLHISGRTLASVLGWLLVIALVTFSAMVALSWDHHKGTRVTSLRTASMEAPVTQALGLIMRPGHSSGTKEGHSQAPEGTHDDAALPAPGHDHSLMVPVRTQSLRPPPEVPALLDWPRNVALQGTPEVRVVSEDVTKGEFIYHTEHFEFCCDAPVGPDAVRHFARVFEATWLLNCLLPLDLRPAPETMRKWFRARILSTDEAYAASGAPAGSSGYYSRADKTIYVPISSLGMKLVGQKRVMLDHSVDSNDTLIHEITHQMMSRWLPRLPVWFAEGSAEYNGIADFVHGRFFLSGMESRLKNHLRSHGAQSAGGTIRFNTLRIVELLAMDNRAWAAGLIGVTGKENYASALLLTYFLYHLDGKRNAAGLIAWLRDIERGRSHEEALKEHVLAGRDLLQFEADFIRAYRQIGIELQVTRRGGAELK